MAARSFAVRAIAVLALLGALQTGILRAQDGGPGATPDPTPEALLAHGIVRAGGSDVLRGIRDLEAAVELRPDWRQARRALGTALLRTGRFESAARELTEALGMALADAMASGKWRRGEGGTRAAGAASGAPEPEAVLGLATARHFAGDVREAEHLYRTYADLVGPMSADAGRAYYRLHEMFEDAGTEWGSADAELAKALAVDPDVGGEKLLPAFLDPRTLPELEPYTRKVELASDRADTAVTYDSLPVLVRWSAPQDTSAASLAVARGELELLIHVGADGNPVEVQVPGAAEDEGTGQAIVSVMTWGFEPARSGDENVAAWIVFDAPDKHESEGEQQE